MEVECDGGGGGGGGVWWRWWCVCVCVWWRWWCVVKVVCGEGGVWWRWCVVMEVECDGGGGGGGGGSPSQGRARTRGLQSLHWLSALASSWARTCTSWGKPSRASWTTRVVPMDSI